MPHHFTKATTEAPIWCNKCYKETRWRVFDGRRQFCIPCWDLSKAKSDAKKNEPQKPVVQQGNLFGGQS